MGMFASLAGIIGKSREEVVASLRKYALSVDGGLQKEDLAILIGMRVRHFFPRI
jgi:hypothetical protein